MCNTLRKFCVFLTDKSMEVLKFNVYESFIYYIKTQDFRILLEDENIPLFTIPVI